VTAGRGLFLSIHLLNELSLWGGGSWAFNECLLWKSQLYSARVPVPICSARPYGVGAGRRFSIIPVVLGCEVRECLGD